jgi:hypothetical protein
MLTSAAIDCARSCATITLSHNYCCIRSGICVPVPYLAFRINCSSSDAIIMTTTSTVFVLKQYAQQSSAYPACMQLITHKVTRRMRCDRVTHQCNALLLHSFNVDTTQLVIDDYMATPPSTIDIAREVVLDDIEHWLRLTQNLVHFEVFPPKTQSQFNRASSKHPVQ